MIILFKGNRYTSRKHNSIKIFFVFLVDSAYIERTQGADSFPLRADLFSQGSSCTEKQTEVKGVVFLVRKKKKREKNSSMNLFSLLGILLHCLLVCLCSGLSPINSQNPIEMGNGIQFSVLAQYILVFVFSSLFQKPFCYEQSYKAVLKYHHIHIHYGR